MFKVYSLFLIYNTSKYIEKLNFIQIHDDYTVICKSLMKKQSNFEIFNNMKVVLSTGEHGFIDGTFGQSGKTKVRIPGNLSYSM